MPSFLIDQCFLRIPSDPCREVSDEELATEAACCVAKGVSDTVPGVYILSTLRHFDSKLVVRPKTGSLIPCQRRLAKTEIPEIQEVTFGPSFGNRDYDRPFLTFLVTLPGFD